MYLFQSWAWRRCRASTEQTLPHTCASPPPPPPHPPPSNLCPLLPWPPSGLARSSWMDEAPADRPRRAPLCLRPLWMGGPVQHALHWTGGRHPPPRLPLWTGSLPRHLHLLTDPALCLHRLHRLWRRSTKTGQRLPPGHRKGSRVSSKMINF